MAQRERGDHVAHDLCVALRLHLHALVLSHTFPASASASISVSGRGGGAGKYQIFSRGVVGGEVRGDVSERILREADDAQVQLFEHHV